MATTPTVAYSTVSGQRRKGVSIIFHISTLRVYITSNSKWSDRNSHELVLCSPAWVFGSVRHDPVLFHSNSVVNYVIITLIIIFSSRMFSALYGQWSPIHMWVVLIFKNSDLEIFKFGNIQIFPRTRNVRCDSWSKCRTCCICSKCFTYSWLWKVIYRILCFSWKKQRETDRVMFILFLVLFLSQPLTSFLLRKREDQFETDAFVKCRSHFGENEME